MRGFLLKQILKRFGLVHVYSENMNNYAVKMLDDIIYLYCIDVKFNVVMLALNDIMLDSMMALDLGAELPKVEGLSYEKELPKAYIENGYSLIKSSEGYMKAYTLVKEGKECLTFVRITYLKDEIFGVNQMTITKEVATAAVKHLSKVAFKGNFDEYYKNYKESGRCEY